VSAHSDVVFCALQIFLLTYLLYSLGVSIGRGKLNLNEHNPHHNRVQTIYDVSFEPLTAVIASTHEDLKQ